MKDIEYSYSAATLWLMFSKAHMEARENGRRNPDL